MARRRQISEIRQRQSFRRVSKVREPRSITLVVCEGETELEYLAAAREHFGLSTAEVVLVDDTGLDPLAVVKLAEERASERGGFDAIFCVFDRDGHARFREARERVEMLANRPRKPLPIKEAIAIPCWEVWVLMHFERTDAPDDNCDQVIARIRAIHMPTYAKADSATAKALMPHLDMARRNGAWLEARGADNEYNPYTNVHALVEHLSAAADGRGPI